ncbi:Hypothetical predicted protein, partial [Pelobates cultripes]
MAAQRGPNEQSTCAQPATYFLGALDQICASFWATLQSRGMTLQLAVKTVASWVRPATRRRYYRCLPQAPRTAIRRRRYLQSPRREKVPRYSHSQIHMSGIAYQASHASTPPHLKLCIKRSTTQPITTSAVHQAIKRRHILQVTTRADSHHRSTKDRAHPDTKRDFPPV